MTHAFCATCGGPNWRADGCRICLLTSMTSQHVTWDNQGHGSFGKAPINYLHLSIDIANSTQQTAATNRYLPSIDAMDAEYMESRDHEGHSARSMQDWKESCARRAITAVFLGTPTDEDIF